MDAVHCIISGNVQGVGLRGWISHHARKFHLTGWVKNRDDDTVEVVVEGEKRRLDAFLHLCRKGPATACINHIEEARSNATHAFTEFFVVY